MCMSAPKVPQVQPAPPPAPPAAPIEEDKAPMVETAVDVDKDEVATKKKRKVGTSALQTSSGLNIPTVSGLNIT
ncbi:hypothetical protein Eistla_gp40 [Pelagibacter phage Eistla EXVC025P]|nr:hypothetical protein Eistla_gp40 [Pelagibacter phage Eistla EXVC025P]